MVGFHPSSAFVDDPEGVRLPLRWLGGDAEEIHFPQAHPAPSAHGFVLHTSGDLLIGWTTQLIDGDVTHATRELYRRLFAVSADRPLYRIWNYVPAINVVNAGLENYRAFCTGRAEAFAAHYGDGFKPRLPAASAVGCAGDALVVGFVAGRTAPRHHENPQQIAAYHYPPEHGPHAPSFARATVAVDGKRPLVFLSGTAAIKGHTTIAPDDLTGQLDCTFDNLRIIARTTGLSETLGADGPWQRHFKVYLRHAADLPTVVARCEKELVRPRDRVIYVEADICRAALVVEIEATLLGA